jgi:GNAT superfamily N-acetyltransferase
MESAEIVRATAPDAPRLLIRRVTESDAGAVAGLLREAFAEFEPLYTPAAFAATVLDVAGVFDRLREGPLWVAVHQSSIIGTVGAVRNGDAFAIRGMAVHPAARGLGAGKALLDRAEQFAAEMGVYEIALYTTAFLDRAIRLYQASGFAFTGGKSNPHGTELLRMTKILAP